MPFAATMKEVREGRISNDISYVNLKRNDTNELTKQKEAQNQRMNLHCWGWGVVIVWGGHVHTAVFKMDN